MAQKKKSSIYASNQNLVTLKKEKIYQVFYGTMCFMTSESWNYSSIISQSLNGT